MNRLLLLALFLSTSAAAQKLPCEALGKRLAADTGRTPWYFSDLNEDSCHCLGRYFARQDSARKVYKILTYGSADMTTDPCRVCRYEDKDFRFEYYHDIVSDCLTQYMEGYNAVSRAELKRRMGDSAYAKIDEPPVHYFNPRGLLNQAFSSGNTAKYLRVQRLDSVTVMAKLEMDSLFRQYPQFLPKIVYHVSDDRQNNLQTLDYRQMKENGCRLTQKPGQRYFLKIVFDFTGIADEEPYCRCALTDKNAYGYILPVTVK